MARPLADSPSDPLPDAAPDASRDGWTEFDAVLAPLVWGRSTYTVVTLPDELVARARQEGTHRLEGWVEDQAVNVGIARADVIPEPFFYAGRSMQRRLSLRPGDAVRCRLRPVDPDVVPLPDDVRAALADADAEEAMAAIPPSDRRRLLVPVEAAATASTRARRVAELVRALR